MFKLRLIVPVLLCAELAAHGEMRMLRPVPASLDSAEYAPLEREAAALLKTGHALCAKYSGFLSSCQGNDSSFCRQQYSAINVELSEFNSAVDSYNAEVVSAMRRRVEKKLTVVRSDQQAIRHLGINRTADEFDTWSEWLKNADDERQTQVEEAFKEAAKALAGEALDKAFNAGVEKFQAVSPQSAKKMVAKLEGLGADNPNLIDAITALGNAKNKAQKADAARRLYEGLKKGKELWALSDLGADNDSQLWKVGDELIENFVPDKQVKLIGKLTLDEVRATFYTVNEAGFDMFVFRQRIGQLNQLTAAQFLALRKLSAQLVRDVGAKNGAQRELNQLDQQPALDVCNSPAALSTVPVAMNCAELPIQFIAR